MTNVSIDRIIERTDAITQKELGVTTSNGEWEIQKKMTEQTIRASERAAVIAEIEGWLVDDVYSRQAQAVIDRRNSDPMCTTPYPKEARWKDERNRFRAELRAKLAEMKGEK